MYSAGNELDPLSNSPPGPILSGIQGILRNFAPDVFLITSTMANLSDFDPSLALAPKDGPYGIMEERMFYERNPGMWDWKNYTQFRLDRIKIPFNPEIGSVSFPTIQSLLRFMSPESAESFPGFNNSNIHPVWEYHKYLGFASEKEDHIYKYGKPANM